MSRPELVSPILGGALIGLAASLLLLFNGRIAGVSGILAGLLKPAPGEWGWRATFVLGLLAGGAFFAAFRREALVPAHGSLALLAVAGMVVGVGSRVGSGCTSAHGICGIGRFSKRSIVATMTFMATGMATVALVRLLGDLS